MPCTTCIPPIQHYVHHWHCTQEDVEPMEQELFDTLVQSIFPGSHDNALREFVDGITLANDSRLMFEANEMRTHQAPKAPTYARLARNQIQQELQVRGLTVRGTKQECCHRLVADDRAGIKVGTSTATATWTATRTATTPEALTPEATTPEATTTEALAQEAPATEASEQQHTTIDTGAHAVASDTDVDADTKSLPLPLPGQAYQPPPPPNAAARAASSLIAGSSNRPGTVRPVTARPQTAGTTQAPLHSTLAAHVASKSSGGGSDNINSGSTHGNVVPGLYVLRKAGEVKYFSKKRAIRKFLQVGMREIKCGNHIKGWDLYETAS